jgi:hypothetical protein
MKDLRTKWKERNSFYNFIAIEIFASQDFEEIIDQLYAEMVLMPEIDSSVKGGKQ